MKNMNCRGLGSRKIEMNKQAKIYRKAARLLERKPGIEYPCFAIAEITRTPYNSYHYNDTYAAEFTQIFSEKEDCIARSDAFCIALGCEGDPLGCDYDDAVLTEHSILALCFAAAIVDAQDAP